MSKLTLGFIPIIRTTFDVPFAQEKTKQAQELLQQAGFNLITPYEQVTQLDEAVQTAQELQKHPIDLIIIFQATFADSTMVQAIAEQVPDVFLFLWGVPEPHTGERLRLNSLCGINLGAHALTRKKIPYAYLYVDPTEQGAIEKIQTYARAGKIKRTLQNTRLGRVGENPTGFETCIPNYDLMKTVFGTEIVQFELQDDIFEPMQSISGEQVQNTLTSLQKSVNGIDAEDTSSQGTIRTYLQLKQIATERAIDGFAVRCWPEFFTEAHCAACGAMSMTSNEMIPSSCEADINGTLTQLILQQLSQSPAFGTDIVSIDAEHDALVVWHCGLAPLEMADDNQMPEATLHSNRQLPLLMQFTLKPGTVTVARISEATGEYRLVIGKADVVRAPMHFSGTSGLLHFEQSAQGILDTIMHEGLEHHISLTYGDYVAELEALAQMLNIPTLILK